MYVCSNMREIYRPPADRPDLWAPRNIHEYDRNADSAPYMSREFSPLETSHVSGV